ncbi:MAG: porin family protein [Balneolaceae bacterium]
MKSPNIFFSSSIIGGLTALTVLFTVLPGTANAQWGVGASYELRDEDPANGFGFRAQRTFLSALPFVDLGIRAHFSYFSDEISVSRDQVSYTSDMEDYDFGLAAFGGINIGLIKPYVGAGLGSERLSEARFDIVGQVAPDVSHDGLYWNVFAGAELAPIPVLKPFIEYRFTRLMGDEDFDHRQNGRLAIGLMVIF